MMVSEERAGEKAPAPKLDDLMLAMDVVDTLRHEEKLVEHELDQTNRDEVLKKRLREIYEGQGLEVSDRILDEGIKALKESRFTYERKGSAMMRQFAMLWVRRTLVGGILATILLVCALIVGNWWWQASSARQEEEAAQVELSQVLPKQLEAAAAAALAEARTEEAKQAVESLRESGAGALSRSDAAGARKAIADLWALRDELTLTYNLMIVQSGQSGVETAPDVNPDARNYYLVVEAIAPDGSKLSRPVTSEETGDTKTVDIWAVRVPEQTYYDVRNDKLDDGIIQDRKLGAKLRGALEPVYFMPVSGGAITKW
jgi:hypothetical protein